MPVFIIYVLVPIASVHYLCFCSLCPCPPDCKSEADQLFEDVLQRKDKADSTRNALNVLQR